MMARWLDGIILSPNNIRTSLQVFFNKILVSSTYRHFASAVDPEVDKIYGYALNLKSWHSFSDDLNLGEAEYFWQKNEAFFQYRLEKLKTYSRTKASQLKLLLGCTHQIVTNKEVVRPRA